MKSKIKGKKTTIPDPYGRITDKTERTAVAVLKQWIREIIEKFIKKARIKVSRKT